MDSTNQDSNLNNQADQSNNIDAGSNPPHEEPVRPDIFSLEAIDDSWMDDESEEFSEFRKKEKPMSGSGGAHPPVSEPSPAVVNRRAQFHYFVQDGREMVLHGQFRTLKMLEREEDLETASSKKNDDRGEKPFVPPTINPQVEATLLEIDQSQQIFEPLVVSKPLPVNTPSVQPQELPKLEDLLSGNYGSIESSKFKVQTDRKSVV